MTGFDGHIVVRVDDCTTRPTYLYLKVNRINVRKYYEFLVRIRCMELHKTSKLFARIQKSNIVQLLD